MSQPVVTKSRIPDPAAVGQLCDQHGAALFNLACAVVGDAALAENIVVEVVARAWADAGVMTAEGGQRRELARLTYLAAAGCLDGSGQLPASTEGARLRRSAVALVQCGDHTLSDVVDLLGLPVAVVAMLLTSGLRDLEAAEARDEGRSGH